MTQRGGGRRLLAVNVTACLLLVQCLLGMVANLFVTLPGRHPGTGASDYFTGSASSLAWVISDGRPGPPPMPRSEWRWRWPPWPPSG